ncbi:ELMO domain-containing protein 1 [Taenia solium]|eukprot:TsM_000667800 transcript=TsM_000667800 gene=TsM_000667800
MRFLLDTFGRYQFVYPPISSSFVSIMYNLYKWLVVLLYGHSELERIMVKNSFGFARTVKIEKSFQLSDNIMIRDGLYSLPLPKYAALVFHEECVANSTLSVDFKQSVIQIRGYRNLVARADALKNSRFSIDDEAHVLLLQDIWNSMLPDEPFSLKSKRWSDIGFQGSCPATDFRGMGVLGAENLRTCSQRLLFFVAPSGVIKTQLSVLLRYPFATVGINLSGLLWRLLQDGTLKTHFYNSLKAAPKLVHLNLVYVYLFVKFNEFWTQQPRDIMQFNVLLGTFEEVIRKQMRDENSTLPLPHSGLCF